jgi:geranylgeranyl pyrophosphate synthase
MGFGTIMAAKDLGLEVPRDVSVIGIDDHTMSPFFDLSTVTQRTREQGKEAVRVLLEILAEPDVEKHNNIDDARDWPVHLVVRGSTAIQRSRALAEGFANEAREALTWLPSSESRSALLALPEFVLSRLY